MEIIITPTDERKEELKEDINFHLLYPNQKQNLKYELFRGWFPLHIPENVLRLEHEKLYCYSMCQIKNMTLSQLEQIVKVTTARTIYNHIYS